MTVTRSNDKNFVENEGSYLYVNSFLVSPLFYSLLLLPLLAIKTRKEYLVKTHMDKC